MKAEQSLNTTKKPRERTFFACKHVVESECISARTFDVDSGGKEVFRLLCDHCYWGDFPSPEEMEGSGLLTVYRNSDEVIAKLEGEQFSEAQAVAKKWIPKSQAMQYLHCVTNDTTAGLAIISVARRLAEWLDDSGLSEVQQEFLHKLFTRGRLETDYRYGYGFAPLTDEEEAAAMRILFAPRSDAELLNELIVETMQDGPLRPRSVTTNCLNRWR